MVFPFFDNSKVFLNNHFPFKINFQQTILSLNGVRCQIGMYSQGIYGGFNAGQPQFGGKSDSII